MDLSDLAVKRQEIVDKADAFHREQRQIDQKNALKVLEVLEAIKDLRSKCLTSDTDENTLLKSLAGRMAIMMPVDVNFAVVIYGNGNLSGYDSDGVEYDEKETLAKIAKFVRDGKYSVEAIEQHIRLFVAKIEDRFENRYPTGYNIVNFCFS